MLLELEAAQLLGVDLRVLDRAQAAVGDPRPTQREVMRISFRRARSTTLV